MKRLLALLLILLCPMLSLAEEAPALPVDFTPGKPILDQFYKGDAAYEDPTISVEITTGREAECDYWIADIKIGHASQLRTAAAESFETNTDAPGAMIAKRMNAVVAMDGDYFCYSGRGFIMRQGQVFLNKLQGARDVLLIDDAGDFHIIYKADAGTAATDEITRPIVNAFFFGPALVNQGKVTNSVDQLWRDMASDLKTQRAALAQVGKLHYKIIVCAAPFRGSAGMTMKQFANFVQRQGVQTAYNLDGGDSSMLYFNGKKINDVDNPKTRDLVDIVYFASAYEGAAK